jgi:hypothetical protein
MRVIEVQVERSIAQPSVAKATPSKTPAFGVAA